MNDQLTKLLIDTLNQGKDAIKQGFLFTQEQIPDIIQQLLYWKFLDNFICFLLGLSLILIPLYIIYWQVKDYNLYINSEQAKKDQKNYFSRYTRTDNSEVSFRYSWYMNGGAAFNAFLILPLAASLLLINIKWLQILIAPKIYLIEYAATLIK